LVEKLTELGVTRLVPRRTQRSVVHPRSDRLERTVIEACKQCGRNRLMEIAPLTEWSVYFSVDSMAIKVLAHPSGVQLEHFESHHASRKELGAQATDESSVACAPGSQIINLAIGPEGGFTDEEVAAAIATGWRTVSLGPRIL